MSAAKASTTQDKVRDLQRRLYATAKSQPTRKFHALYDKVYRPDVLRRAWENVRANRGAPGIDQTTIADIEAQGVERFLDEIHCDLRIGRYRPAPLRRVYIPKKDGRKRGLGIPILKDRVCQAAAKIVLEPVLEADFLPCSYGFRPRRNATQAMEAIRLTGNRGQSWVADFDIKGAFDHIAHYILVGTGGLAANVFAELTDRNLPVTLIVDRRKDEPPWNVVDQVEGDPADTEVLKKAGIMDARALLSLLDNDGENAFVVLAARASGTEAKTVVSVRDRVNLARIRTVRPDMILAMDVIGAQILGMALTGESVDGDLLLKKVLFADGDETEKAPESS